MSGARRVIPLTLGWVELPKSYSITNADPDERVVEPICAAAILADEGWVLLDCGPNPTLFYDPPLRRRFHPPSSPDVMTLIGDGEDPLLLALSHAGIEIDDIVAVAISHLHYDHCGGLRHFADGPPIYIQERELNWAVSNARRAEENGIYQIDFDDPKLRFVPLSSAHATGEPTPIAGGVGAIPTFGHTTGHQSFVVQFEGGGGLLFAFDAADLMENITDEVAIGGTIGVDDQTTVKVIQSMKRIARDYDLTIVPGHDPQLWPTLTTILAEHDGLLPTWCRTERLFELAEHEPRF